MTGSVEREAKTVCVLCVDDEVTLLRSYERLLRRSGYEVLTAQRAEEALAIVESTDVALVIVDLTLPDMDGLDLIRALRARPAPPLVIVSTGSLTEGTRQAAVDAGAAGYFPKPFSVSGLMALVRLLLVSSND